jgi:hypothetical protein
VAKLRERISTSKQARQKFDFGRFFPRKLDDVEVMGQYQVGISNKFAGVWKSAKENLEYCTLKHNKPWFDECSKLIDK